MVKNFANSWYKNKDKLEKYFKTHKQSKYMSYRDLVKLIFDIIINPELNCEEYDTDNIMVLDDGDYQGTQIFILHRKTYQPSIEDYVYTNVSYGSCSYCDTLLSISEYDYGLPNKNQVKDYMTLCLHLLQRCVFMKDEEDVEYEEDED